MQIERRSGGERRFAAQQEERPITVVLVDAEHLLRAGVAQALRSDGIEIVGETANGDDAVELVVALRPDVVLTGLGLPGLSGVEMIRRIGALAPASHILVLTRSEQNQVVEAIVAGATGYILKTAPPEAIVRAVRATAAGESALSPEIAGKLLDRVREAGIPVTATSELDANAIRGALTTREMDIFRLLASGQSNQEIGRQLALSTNTVANHIKSILAKLHVDNRIQAAVHAVRSGIS